MTHDHQTPNDTRSIPLYAARFRPFAISVALCIGALPACSGESLDLGQQPIAVDRSALTTYAATWEGYAEAFAFDSGSDRVRISIGADGSGSMVFGDGEPPAVPTDPDDPFPGVDQSDGLLRRSVVEGFEYGVANARVESERIRAQARSGERFDAACGLQTSFTDAANPGFFGCVPNVGSSSRDGVCFLSDADETPISCERLELCLGNRACDCDADGCTGNGEQDVELDAALDADATHLVGTLRLPTSIGDTNGATVRLTRLEP